MDLLKGTDLIRLQSKTDVWTRIIKLKQGQIWKRGNEYFRITEWSRMFIQYKLSYSLHGSEETMVEVTKKEFCQIIKGAVLCESEE